MHGRWGGKGKLKSNYEEHWMPGGKKKAVNWAFTKYEYTISSADVSIDWLPSFESGIIISMFPEKKLKLQFIIKNSVYGHTTSKWRSWHVSQWLQYQVLRNWKLVELKRLITTFVNKEILQWMPKKGLGIQWGGTVCRLLRRLLEYTKASTGSGSRMSFQILYHNLFWKEIIKAYWEL